MKREKSERERREWTWSVSLIMHYFSLFYSNVKKCETNNTGVQA
jgi:hypothetical protein